MVQEQDANFVATNHAVMTMRQQPIRPPPVSGRRPDGIALRAVVEPRQTSQILAKSKCQSTGALIAF